MVLTTVHILYLSYIIFFQIDRLEHINYNSFFQQAKSAKKLFPDGGDDDDNAVGGVASSHITGGPNVIMEVCRI